MALAVIISITTKNPGESVDLFVRNDESHFAGVANHNGPLSNWIFETVNRMQIHDRVRNEMMESILTLLINITASDDYNI